MIRARHWLGGVTLLIAIGGPAAAWPEGAEPARSGQHERQFAAAFAALRLGEPSDVAVSAWRRGRGLQVELPGLEVLRASFTGEAAARTWAEGLPLEPQLRAVERRGHQVVVVSGPALENTRLRKRALRQAWSVLPLPEGELERRATWLAPAPAPAAAGEDGLPLDVLIEGIERLTGSGGEADGRSSRGSAPAAAMETSVTTVAASAPRADSGHGARDMIGHYLLGEDLSPLARAGAQGLSERTTAHRESIAWRGVGLYFGDHASYKDWDDERRREWMAERATGDAPLPTPRESSCIGWALENVGAAYQAVGRGDVWAQIKRRVVARGSMGTVLAKELVNDGWTAYYFNPDTRNPSDGDAEHTYTARMARNGRPYYEIPLAGLITNYQPSRDSDTPLDTSGLERLEQVPFWFGLARGGRHTFVGHGATVNEFHWTAMPDNPEAMEETALADFAWLSGVIVVPPRSWPR